MPTLRGGDVTLDRAAAPVRALILMGVSGSGKSTIASELAKRLKWTVVDADAFHPPGNVEKMRTGHPLTDEDRWPWLRAIAAEIDRKLSLGEHIVVACSALKQAYREILVHGQKDVRIVYLRGSRNLIANRLEARQDHFMPPRLLDSQFKALEEPHIDEGPIVVEIDTSVDRIVDHIVEELRCEKAVCNLPNEDA